MDKQTCNDLLKGYLTALADDWGFIRTGDAEIPLTQVFVMLETINVPKPKSGEEKRPEIVETPERLSHAGYKPSEKEKTRFL